MLVLLCALSMGCTQKTPTAPTAPDPPARNIGAKNDESKDKVSKFSGFTEAHAYFRGWLGESVVLKQEEFQTEQNRNMVSWLIMQPDGTMRDLLAQPSGVAPGEILVKETQPKSPYPLIAFRMEGNPTQLRALEDALAEWHSKGEGNVRSFPIVGVTLLLEQVKDGGPNLVIWRETTTVTAERGEAGYEYEAPHLRFAALSPTRRTLYAEIAGGGDPRHLRIPLDEDRR